jgi:hypothetical protein
MSLRPPFLSAAERACLDALGRGELALAEHAAVLPQAIVHGIAAHCARVAQKAGQEVPQAWSDRLLQVEAQNLLVHAQLRQLTESLNAAGIPWLAGKGWLRQLDPLLGARLMGDVDIYVAEAAKTKLFEALAGAYTRSARRGDARTSARVLRPQSTGVSLDVHFAVHGALAATDAPIEPLVERAERRGAVPCPSPADDYIITLFDALCGAWNNPLRRLWELRALSARLPTAERSTALAAAGLKPDAERGVEAAFASRWLQRNYRSALALTLCRASLRPTHRLLALAALRFGMRR